MVSGSRVSPRGVSGWQVRGKPECCHWIIEKDCQSGMGIWYSQQKIDWFLFQFHQYIYICEVVNDSGRRWVPYSAYQQDDAQLGRPLTNQICRFQSTWWMYRPVQSLLVRILFRVFIGMSLYEGSTLLLVVDSFFSYLAAAQGQEVLIESGM